MSKDSKFFETLGFALLPAFVIYNWIYDPRISGFLFLTQIALILWWLYSMFHLVFVIMGVDKKIEPATHSFYWPLAMLNVLALLATVGFYILSAIFTMLDAL